MAVCCYCLEVALPAVPLPVFYRKLPSTVSKWLSQFWASSRSTILSINRSFHHSEQFSAKLNWITKCINKLHRNVSINIRCHKTEVHISKRHVKTALVCWLQAISWLSLLLYSNVVSPKYNLTLQTNVFIFLNPLYTSSCCLLFFTYIYDFSRQHTEHNLFWLLSLTLIFCHSFSCFHTTLGYKRPCRCCMYI